jgi:hypothetical protein
MRTQSADIHLFMSGGFSALSLSTARKEGSLAGRLPLLGRDKGVAPRRNMGVDLLGPQVNWNRVLGLVRHNLPEALRNRSVRSEQERGHNCQCDVSLGINAPDCQTRICSTSILQAGIARAAGCCSLSTPSGRGTAAGSEY